MSYCGPFEHLKAEPIAGVRSALSGWLRAGNCAAACFLPEWICCAMGDSVRAAGVEPIFYPVLPPSKAAVPLALDSEWLMRRLRPGHRLILAHPLGYIDRGIATLLAWAQPRGVPVFLDIAQSYGRTQFVPEVQLAGAAYLSCNGRKLLGEGGGYALRPSPAADPTYAQLRARIEKAWHLQAARFAQLQAAMTRETSRVILGHSRWLAPQTRSSMHRTCVDMDADRCRALRVRLEALGYGQPLHGSPQGATHLPSAAYRQWQQDVFCLFSEPRAGTQAVDVAASCPHDSARP